MLRSLILDFIRIPFFKACTVFLSISIIASCGGGGGGSGDGGGNDGTTTPATYTLTVETSGLTGSGLSVGVSSDAGIETLSIISNGSRQFSIAFPEGALYTAGIGSQPAGQQCQLGGRTFDTNMTSNATITIACADTRTISGTVTGLTGTVDLRLSGTGISSSTASFSNGNIEFTENIAIGDFYAVNVATQPDGETCLVTNSSGEMTSAGVTDVLVTCSPSEAGYKVGGYISGFGGVLKIGLNGVEEYSTIYNGSFNFAFSLSTGASFAVTVLSQPVGYQCTVKNGNGVMSESDYPFVDIDCKSTSTLIKPQVDPDGAWLDTGETMTLTLNGTTDITLDDWDFNEVSFLTGLYPDDEYVVSVITNPPGRICTLRNSAGVIEVGVTPVVTMSCVVDTNELFSVGGSITGLTGDGLVINLDHRESLAIAATDTTFTFTDLVPDTTSHTSYVVSQPAGQICTFASNSAYVSGSNFTSLNLICSQGPHQIGGSVVGLQSSGLSLVLNDSEVLNVTSAGAFNFNTLMSDGMSYKTAINSQPEGQVCSINSSTGSSISSSVADIYVECVEKVYAVKVNVKGYSSSTPLLLRLNNGEALEVTSNTISSWYPYDFMPHAFTTPLKTGESYRVEIAGQPEGQLCEITSGSGTVVDSDIENIGVVCQSLISSGGPYNITVTTSGLIGSGLVLQLNGGSDLSVPTNDTQSFLTQLADAEAYDVTVVAQPSAPLQMCKVVNGAGTVAANDVTTISVQCGNAVQPRYEVNGKNWLDYLNNDGASVSDASGAACDPSIAQSYNSCIHGAEVRSIAVPSLVSCTNVTAEDALNVFNWICDDTNGVRIVSTGLKAGIALSDLIDFDTASFRKNSVSVYESMVLHEETESAIWWSNRFVTDSNISKQSGDIQIVSGYYWSLDMPEKSALLVRPGFVCSGKVYVTGKNYLWIEGEYSGVTTETGVHISSASFVRAQNVIANSNYFSGFSLFASYSKVNNVSADMNGSGGVYINGNGNSVSDISASNNSGRGIELRGDNAAISQLVVTNNSSDGFYYSGKNSLVDNVTATGNLQKGLFLYPNGGVAFSNINSESNATGVTVYAGSSVGNAFTNVVVRSNNGAGFYANGLAESSVENVIAENNLGYGLEFRNANFSELRNVDASGNTTAGIYLQYWDNSRIDQVNTVENNGVGMHVIQADNLRINQLQASNNTANGVLIESSSNTISANVLSTNNNGSGIHYISNGSENMMLAATAANNFENGILITATSRLQLLSVMPVNNAVDGLAMNSSGNFLSVDNVIAANNSGYGFNLDSSDSNFTGLVKTGSNSTGDCIIGVNANNSGISQGGTNGNPNNTCVISGTSDGTLTSGVDISTTVIGKVLVDDVLNLADNSGASLFENISDWSQFDNTARNWGLDGSAFANGDNAGACNTIGDNCRIWDWSLTTADTVSNNTVAVPVVTDTVTKEWLTFSATDQAYCDTYFPGSVWDGVYGCTSTYLRNAQEILDDGIGNDNLLCEAGETCLHMPNIGYYQGHGVLVDTVTLGTGGDAIMLKQYQTLGR